MDKDFSMTTEALYLNEMTSQKAFVNRIETMKLIDKHGGLHGNVLDIGEENYFSYILKEKYPAKIYNTWRDLDTDFNVPLLLYDFVHYNNVIEHQFNPLYTLLCIRKVLKDSGMLILGTPVKPNWITYAKCHFHEMDQYRFDKLILRAGFRVIDCVKFWRDVRFTGIRGILGSFYLKQSVYLLRK